MPLRWRGDRAVRLRVKRDRGGVAAGSDMVAVSLFVPVTPWQLLAKSEYKTPEDLRGKVVGVASKGGSSEVAADLSLQRLKLDPNKDVTKQALGSVANGLSGGASAPRGGGPPGPSGRPRTSILSTTPCSSPGSCALQPSASSPRLA